ncbi:MAG TPA: ATP synthase F1 subunit gamma [Solirubrobacterales bacterium]|nr:ATP synthase F1 subunit gamma [Solirubrobacterales bacterium]
MASRKEVKNQIASVKNISTITRAMEMVAGARLRRAEQRIGDLRPYAQALRKLTRRAAEEAGSVPHVPVLVEREQVSRVGVLLITGDRGLAGAFNANIVRAGLTRRDEVRDEGAETSFSVVGRRGESALNFREQTVAHAYTGFTDRPAFADARGIGDDLVAAYIDGELDRVELIYNRYVSPMTQYVRRQTLLPMQQAEVFGEGISEQQEEETEIERAHKRSLWEYEPDAEELLARLVPDYINISVYRALLESAASEHGARMTAMRNAAENAHSMIADLTLEMNRARQAEITQEILEVVGGAEALG